MSNNAATNISPVSLPDLNPPSNDPAPGNSNSDKQLQTRGKRTEIGLNFSDKQLMSLRIECRVPFIRSRFKKIESSRWLGGARGKKRRRCGCASQSAVSTNVTNITCSAQLLQQLRMFRARFDDARQPKVGGRQPRKLQRRAARTIFRCLCFLRERVHMGS